MKRENFEQYKLYLPLKAWEFFLW